jgi:hypothetical protein
MYAPQVIYADGSWRMWYSAFADNSAPVFGYRGYAEGDVDQIAASISRYDGSSWQEYPIWQHNGTLWRRPDKVNRYDGSSWVETTQQTASVTTPPDAIPEFPKRVDGFEDSNLDEYSGDLSDFGVVNTPTQELNYALEGQSTDSSNAGHVTSLNGLSYYPSQGNTFRFWCRTNSDTDTLRSTGFGVQGTGDTPDAYFVDFNRGSGSFALVVRDAGSVSTVGSASQSWSNDTWYEVEVDWGAGGTITATLFDDSGSQLNQVSGSDSSHTNGGIMFRIDNSPNSSVHWDYFRLTG